MTAAVSATAASCLLDKRYPHRGAMFEDVVRGLTSHPKTLPCKYLYDERGCELFDAICDLPEYYPTRTELAIMRDRVAEMASWIGPRPIVIEWGSGSGLKTERLLAAVDTPTAYVPVEIAPEYLASSVARLKTTFPDLTIRPICADFTQPFRLPKIDGPSAGSASTEAGPGRRIVYFPGSTLGNFAPAQRQRLLQQMADLVGVGGGVLLGLDLIKDRQSLEAAYDDAAGVTAEFNLNLLTRINRELKADFDLDQFSHRAIWNADASRIEMHLVSRCRQQVRLADRTILFERSETVCTEYSHKFDREAFAASVGPLGFQLANDWSDVDDQFAVIALDRVT